MVITLTVEASYNETIPTDLADKLGQTFPYAVSRLLFRGFLHHKAMSDSERFDALERAGFKVERYGDLAYHIFYRYGGHYVDVGASGKIAKGLVSRTHIPAPNFYRKGFQGAKGITIDQDQIRLFAQRVRP